MPNSAVYLTDIYTGLGDTVGSIRSLAFSEDGKHLAVISDIDLGYEVYLFDSESGRRISAIGWTPLQYSVHPKVCVAVCDDSLYGAVVSHSDSTIKIWDIKKRKHLRDLTAKLSLQDMVFSDDGGRLAVAYMDCIQVWNSLAGHCMRNIPINWEVPEYGMRFLSSGSYLFLCDGYGINLGPINPKVESRCFKGHYCVSDDREWIKKDSRNFLCLPEKCWTRSLAFVIQGSRIALETRSGSIILMRFS